MTRRFLPGGGGGGFVVLYGNFISLAFLGLLGFLRRQLKTKFIAALLRAAKGGRTEGTGGRDGREAEGDPLNPKSKPFPKF